MFTYDENYFKSKNIIPLGPEFPLTERKFKSETLFPSFNDRIPSRENPAYAEYCEALGIDPNEKDSIVLLSTIGRKGPSSFIFYPDFEHEVSHKDLLGFRKLLGLTTREFANVFEISQASLNALERSRGSGKEILKRFEIIINFPEVALYYLTINGGFLGHKKWVEATHVLKQKLN